MGNIIVQKYGGTSVGDIDRIRNVSDRVVKECQKGNKVVVVVSAMGKTTDDLIKKATALSSKPSDREMDMLLSTGEQISVSLLAIAVNDSECKAISLTGSQCGIITDFNHKKARIDMIKTDRIMKELESHDIVIVAGFQGVNRNHDITTLGRGGSDTTAVALAAALKAEKCEIYTDVDGVYSSDPRKVKGAKKLNRISYDEMLEMAALGAGVLHPRSVELARKYDVPLEVKSSFVYEEGTKIINRNSFEETEIRGVTLDEDISKVSLLGVPDVPGIAFKIFSELSENNIPVDMIIQNVNHNGVNDISFAVKGEDYEKTMTLCERLANDIGAKGVIGDENVVKLSVVGTGISGNTKITSLYFKTLYEMGINIQMISTSQIKISCIIKNDKGIDALNKVHDIFEEYMI